MILNLCRGIYPYNVNQNKWQTRMHSSRMRTTCTSSRPGGSPQGTPRADTPPWTRHPPGPGIPPVNRMTDRCKNITLPQTSFAGGNNITISYYIERSVTKAKQYQMSSLLHCECFPSFDRINDTNVN